MKLVILFIGILTSAPSFAADDQQVAHGLEQVRRARHELADFLRSLPRPLRGYAVQGNTAKSAFTSLHEQSYHWRHTY
jgi:hypothetical protein